MSSGLTTPYVYTLALDPKVPTTPYAGTYGSSVFKWTPMLCTLSVAKAGPGSGTVISNPPGIECGTDCTKTYACASATPVAFSGAASAGSTFSGWNGDCARTGACVVTMDQDRSVTAPKPTAAEAGPDPGVYSITCSGGNLAAPVTVTYTLDGMGSNGVDYELLPAAVAIPANQTTATVTITPIDDTLMEGEETITLTLVGNSTNTAGSPKTATVTILSDEVVTVTATDPIATEGGVKGTLTFMRTGSTAVALPVAYSITGTATPGSDYTTSPPFNYATRSTCVTIPAGKSTATVTVTPLADRVHERNESMILTLNSRTAYTPGNPSKARVITLNEDLMPTLR